MDPMVSLWDFRLEEVRAPVRIWQGLADKYRASGDGPALAAALPHSELRCLADEGHLSLIVRHLDGVLAGLGP